MKIELKTVSKILLVVQLVAIAAFIGVYFQTEYQLSSPVIPKSMIGEIARPYLLLALITTITLIPAFILYFYSRFLATTILCLLSLLFSQFFFNFYY